MLSINIAEERQAIAMYRKLLSLADETEMTWLHETIQDILADEEEHLYELTTLQG